VSVAEHKAISKNFVDFMAGGDLKHVELLRAKMNSASDSQQYELAAAYRDDIDALEAVLEKSTVVFSDQTDADVFGIAEDELAAAVSMFIVRAGRIRGVRGWVIDKELERSTGELVEYVMQNVYAPIDGAEQQEVPKEIIVPLLPEDSNELNHWLTDLRGKKVDLHVASRGDKAGLASTALVNAKHSLMIYKNRRSSDFTARAEALSAIQKTLGLESAPLRIECYDVSHLGGTDVVASMVVFEDGLAKKDQYRRFSIENTKDDTDSIYQVLSRRLKYLKDPDDSAELDPSGKFSYRPSLLIVDGGLPQVNAAQRAIDDSGVAGLAVIGLAKRLEEVWVPQSNFPIIFPRATDELFLLQRIRDEAHRFALAYQRQKRSKSVSSQLGDIPGLGDKRVNALLKHFGSAKRLRGASAEEIAEVAGIGPILAQEILTALA
jgi:excinuclease ABC subunit C